ncbi:MAG TPA: TMEM165/GDT1 family protein [Steroidobacteraceae bacterium]|jgi:putative Ca2+/H+ antiporter (TMEM165/GDT1 family)|nr:TMEM165/GDT1 family protein [Steroidobacteraceae bacterium]
MEAFLVSIASVALGELGDKTQLLALILATQLRRPVAVILGVLVSTLANHLIAALAGQWAGSLLSPLLLRWILGISFLVLAAWVWIPDKLDDKPRAADGYGAFIVTATAFFMAEMGDKTQIVALALAAKYRDLIAVVAGTTIGMMIVNVPTVLLAEKVTRVVPLNWIRVAAALVYALLGVLTLLGFAGLGIGGKS